MAPRRRREELSSYEKKRDFSVTSEPPPAPEGGEEQAGLPIFVVHKHDATTLHYDLRLEIDGALPSWAIPKGPSYDPAQKRLAVETEDHPLAYASFEGRIPDDEYGGGDTLIWDRGKWDTVPPGHAAEQKKKGHIRAVLVGRKLRGEWHLIRTRMRGKKQQWLLIKAHDGLEDPDLDIVAERPESVQSGRRVTRGPVHLSTLRRPQRISASTLLHRMGSPMLGELAKADLRDEDDYLFEVKYDGYRALAALSAGELSFHSRNDLDLSGRFPEIAKALHALRVREAVLDGEVVALDRRGRSSFEELAEGEGEVRFIAFDLLWLDGEDLRERPLEERREYLESVLANVRAPIVIAERLRGSLAQALEVARRRGLEGVIAKRRGSPYVEGRSRAWRKVKLRSSQELVIVGYTPISSGKRSIGALLLGVREGDGFRYAGKVGTGFTDRTREELYRELSKDRITRPRVEGAGRIKGARWVRPRLVAEIEFSEWTRDGKLRQPSFQGLRIDKAPEEVVRERVRAAGPARASRGVGARVREESSSAPKAEARRRDVAGGVTLAEAIAAGILTHPDRVVYPDAGYTKADAFAYMAAIAPILVNLLDGRPLFFQQWPQGIQGQGFFRHNMSPAPSYVTRIKVPHDDGRIVNHVIIDKPETVLWLANQSAFALHMWSSRIPWLEQPNWVIFDLDPGEGPWTDLIFIANTLRDFLDQLGLRSFVKTTGKRGLHVLVPIRRGPSHDEATAFAVEITSALAVALPELATVERIKSKRGGKLYLDAMQNGAGKAIIAPYSLRDTPQATVSAPLEWSEVTQALDPTRFTMKTMPARLAERGDLFAGLLEIDQPLPKLR